MLVQKVTSPRLRNYKTNRTNYLKSLFAQWNQVNLKDLQKIWPCLVSVVTQMCGVGKLKRIATSLLHTTFSRLHPTCLQVNPGF